MSDHLIISHLCTDWVIFSSYKNCRQGQARGVSDSWYQCHESIIRTPPRFQALCFGLIQSQPSTKKNTVFFVVYLLLNPCCWREFPSKRKTPMLSCFVTRVLALSTHMPALACSSLTPVFLVWILVDCIVLHTGCFYWNTKKNMAVMAVMAVMDAFLGISCRNQMVTSVCGGYREITPDIMLWSFNLQVWTGNAFAQMWQLKPYFR